jgi:WD40 repeat protein
VELLVAEATGGRLLAVGFLDGTVLLWEVRGGTALQTLREQGEAVEALAFAAQGRLLVAAAPDGSIRRWDTGLARGTVGWTGPHSPRLLRSVGSR